MEIKLSVSIGATLQVKNARGEWDWIKPEVGAEVKLLEGDIDGTNSKEIFAEMWDNIVGPQFASVVQELIEEQTPKKETPEEFREALLDAADGDPKDEVDATSRAGKEDWED